MDRYFSHLVILGAGMKKIAENYPLELFKVLQQSPKHLMRFKWNILEEFKAKQKTFNKA